MVVGNQSTCAQVVFDEYPEVGLGGHSFAQHFPSGDMSEMVVAHKARRLGPFAGAWRAKEYQVQLDPSPEIVVPAVVAVVGRNRGELQ